MGEERENHTGDFWVRKERKKEKEKTGKGNEWW